jgi:hypothetical protein
MRDNRFKILIRRIKMKQSSLSMLVFGIYEAILCVIFIVFPNQFCALFKLNPPDGFWIRVFGMVLGILAFYYLMAVHEDNRSFYHWTFYGRLVILPTFAVFVILGIAPPIVLLFGAWDTGCGIWTGIALQREERLIPALRH